MNGTALALVVVAPGEEIEASPAILSVRFQP